VEVFDFKGYGFSSGSRFPGFLALSRMPWPKRLDGDVRLRRAEARVLPKISAFRRTPCLLLRDQQGAGTSYATASGVDQIRCLCCPGLGQL